MPPTKIINTEQLRGQVADFYEMACSMGEKPRERKNNQRGGTEETETDTFLKSLLCNSAHKPPEADIDELLGNSEFVNVFLTHLQNRSDLKETVLALRGLNKSIKSATGKFEAINPEKLNQLQAFAKMIAILLEQLKQFYANPVLVSQAYVEHTDALENRSNTVTFEINFTMDRQVNNINTVDTVYLIWKLEEFNMNGDVFTKGVFAIVVDNNNTVDSVFVAENNYIRLQDRNPGLPYYENVYKAILTALTEGDRNNGWLKANLGKLLDKLTITPSSKYVMDVEYFNYSSARLFFAIAHDIIKVHQLTLIPNKVTPPPQQVQPPPQVQPPAPSVVDMKISRIPPSFYLSGTFIKHLLQNYTRPDVTQCVIQLNKNIKDAATGYFKDSTTLGEWLKKRKMFQEKLTGIEKDIQKNIIDLETIQKQFIEKLQTGGAKRRTKYTPTAHTHTAKDGIRRKVYSKNGKHYIKRKVDNKFVYRLVRLQHA